MAKKKSVSLVTLLGLGLLVVVVWRAVATRAQPASAAAPDWRSNWAVTEGFSVDIDTTGYHFPTAIAFVPQPGPAPKDPLYFVTELRGTVKVVTNDRTVYTFAEDFFQLTPARELPALEGETGLAGICLAPEQGYVFVTFAYEDAEGVLRNNVVRFQSEPQTFSLEPSALLDFHHIFARAESAISHQIGGCQVQDGSLFVSVADGRQTAQSQQVDSILGKVLRLTLDGQPVPDNPFYQDGATENEANYVWVYGLRNPFGLKAVGDRLFIADNGSRIDRFLEAHKGENFLWDGTDWSIGTNTDVVLAPAIGPVQVDYLPEGGTIFPEQYAGSFFVASSAPGGAGVLTFPYSLTENKLVGVPKYLVRYQGQQSQSVVGLGLGQDGLYFIPILPDEEGRSAVFRVSHAPGGEYPYLLTAVQDPVALMADKGCFGCHSLNGEGGMAGPPLDRGPLVARLQEALHSEAYRHALDEVDQLDREPFTNFSYARANVKAAAGDARIRTWMIYHIMEPRFDNPASQMPNLGLSRAEATLITDYLLEETSLVDRAKAALLQRVPRSLQAKHLVFAFGGGFVAGASLLAFLVGTVALVRRRRQRIEDVQ